MSNAGDSLVVSSQKRSSCVDTNRPVPLENVGLRIHPPPPAYWRQSVARRQGGGGGGGGEGGEGVTWGGGGSAVLGPSRSLQVR